MDGEFIPESIPTSVPHGALNINPSLSPVVKASFSLMAQKGGSVSCGRTPSSYELKAILKKGAMVAESWVTPKDKGKHSVSLMMRHTVQMYIHLYCFWGVYSQSPCTVTPATWGPEWNQANADVMSCTFTLMLPGHSGPVWWALCNVKLPLSGVKHIWIVTFWWRSIPSVWRPRHLHEWVPAKVNTLHVSISVTQKVPPITPIWRTNISVTPLLCCCCWYFFISSNPFNNKSVTSTFVPLSPLWFPVTSFTRT